VEWGGPGAADDGDEALLGAGSHLRVKHKKNEFQMGMRTAAALKRFRESNGARGTNNGGAIVRVSW
jgi:hypothetical protein